MPDADTQFAAAVAAHQAGNTAEAERLYRELVAAHPGHAAGWCNLGVLLVHAGKPDDAATCYVHALTAVPGHPDAHFNLGNLYRRAARLPEAAAEYRNCLNGNPNHSAAWFNLGLCHAATTDLIAAVEAFSNVVRLEPQSADAYLRLGDSLMRAGRLADAVAAFRTGVNLRPDDPRGLYNLGLGLANIGQTDEAFATLTQALQLNPKYAEAHNALGLTLESLGRKDDAQRHYQQAVQCRPDFADGWCNLGTNLGEQGRTDEAIQCLRHSLAIRPAAPPVHSNLLLLLNYASAMRAEDVFAEHRNWADRHAGPAPNPPPVPLPHDPDRRLRIGYLSADFRKHTVSGFIELLLRHHDRTNVEVFAYAHVLRPDETTETHRGLADHWRPIAGLTDDRAAGVIRDDGIDVLVDLGGHTASNRLLVMARRPAPVQATLFGYPNTTGLAAVDCRITDPLSDPDGGPGSPTTEAPLRLAGPAWVYRPPDDAPPVGPLPGLSHPTLTLGCLNNPAKFSDACLDAWAEILRTVPNTRLVLLAGHAQAGAKRLADRFATAGIGPDRLELLPRMPAEQYLAAHRAFDLYLDPFPYNGGVTTCDALWMGVPVVAVAGSDYRSRQGLGLMTRIGLPEFVVGSPAELAPKVREWADRRAELAMIREGLRDRLAASPVCDAGGYVRDLEAAYRRAWQQRLAE